MKYTIEWGVQPVDFALPRTRGRPPTFPLKYMVTVGDSFTIPIDRISALRETILRQPNYMHDKFRVGLAKDGKYHCWKVK